MSKRYEIREQIGKGGLGAVYKAFDTQLHREVAIKRVLSASQASEDEVKESADKLIAEAQTLSSLNHPNIVTVFDVGQDEEGGFVVMELLKGETLDETVARGVLTQEDFTEVVYQTLEALIAAQANDVIHRDIKPTNIMVIWQASGKFQLKILDFGLAKFSKTPSVQTMDQEESVMGSIFFMAPEQFERGELDARTDLYQMGCVYYNALTGQYPFNGETAPQVMNAHLQHRVIPLEQIRPDLSPSICQWVMWMINRDIDHRPADAREALKRWPRNPEPPGAAPRKVLPVEDTPQVSTGEVTVVRVVRSAAAPPSLIVPGASGSAPIAAAGSTTGRLRSGTQTGSHGRPTGPVNRGGGKGNVKKSAVPEGGGKGKWILIGGGVVLIAIFGITSSVKNSKEKKRQARIVELATAERPVGTVADIALAVSVLGAGDTPAALKGNAAKVLSRVQGTGINEALQSSMREVPSLSVKMALAQALAERDHTAAVGDIINVFKSATTDDQRIQILQSIRALASLGDIDPLLGALHSEHTVPVRKAFEDTVLAVLRQGGDTGAVIDKIIAKVPNAVGSERQSLFRILGTLGGDKTKALLDTIFSGSDVTYQREALSAYLNWRDRSVAPQVEQIITGTGDEAMRSAAEKAYVRLASLPGPEPAAERVPYWSRAFELARKPADIQELFSSMVEHPDPESLKLLREWQKHPTHGKMAKNFGDILDKAMKSVVELKPGEEIKGNKARIRGDRAAAINSNLSSLTGWVSTDTYFSWYFKVAEAGEYRIEVDQATPLVEPSRFVVYVAGKGLSGESQSTGGYETFAPVKPEGTITLAVGTIYTLTIAAGSPVQPRMMDIGAVRIVKP